MSANVNAILDDLEWAITSPLLYGAPPPQYSGWVTQAPPLVSRLRGQPELLPEGIEARRRVPIGRYFERLVGIWLNHQPNIGALHENLPIHGGRGTLGELDLVFESAGIAYHWELALKFYLGVGERDKPASWHGPQGRDRLDRKLEKLSSHQLQLPSSREGRALLATLGIDSITSHSLIKGYLFHPFRDWQANALVVPVGTNTDHLRGWWLSLADSPTLQELPAAGWRVLEKPEWLAPTRGGALIAPADLSEALRESLAGARSTMVAAVGSEGQELSRGFVVPDDWPPLA